MRSDPLWCELVERLWVVVWLALYIFVAAAALPAGFLAGLRILGLIVKKVTP